MMNASKPIHGALLFLLIFSITSFKSIHCMGNKIILCPDIEKQSLLNFKRSLQDPDNLLSSWDGEVNCCKWKGVICNNFTGHVHELHLQSNPDMSQGLSGKINPSLLNLKHLKFLDLSQNDFTGETIPSFIGSFTNLEYLNLSAAGFHGKIPHNIGNLSILHTLDLAEFGLHEFFDAFTIYESVSDVDSLEWLSGLSHLEYLNMNGVNLSKATNWAQVINTLPSLLELRFKYSSLDFMTPLNFVNSTSLTLLDLSRNTDIFSVPVVPRWTFQLTNLLSLDLSSNNLKGPIPTMSNATKIQHIDLSRNNFNSSISDWLDSCQDLEFVDLSSNFLHGTIPNAIANQTSLKTLDLSSNQLSGKIPREITNLCKINTLDLFSNELEGEISDLFGNMSECFLGSVEYLSLERNKLSGHLIDQFGEFKILQHLGLGENSLYDTIPINLGKLSSLESLSLTRNKFSGNLPESLGLLFNLEKLWIGENMLEGVVTETFFANLTKLETFAASGNNLTLEVSSNWIPPFTTLGLGSWNLGTGSQIPSWLETQNNISALDLSNTGISDNIPSWFWEIEFLNLSHNHLHGKIPDVLGARYVYLSSNQFSGSLPRIEDTVAELDLSNNSFSGGLSHFLCDRASETYYLTILHLGGNQLSGELPDCWRRWPDLIYLNLGNNNMSGSIPNSIGHLEDLKSLNLYSNKFSGLIPSSMQNCTKLMKIDFGGNDLSGSIPTWMGTSLVNLRILILRSNNLSGKISSAICCLNSLQILDLSDNKFLGIIPRCVYNFTSMATKRSLPSYRDYPNDYSYSNSLYWGTFLESASIVTKGSEFQYGTILSLVTNIDLSKNNLSGDIPKELTTLVELISLNLSENHLTGVIPDDIGDMKQLGSLDLSINSLSGEVPKSLSLIASLSYLNLSYNKLTGRIPEGTQLLGFNASSFMGNNLCGPPLSNCSHDGDEVHAHTEENEGDKPDIQWLYVFLSLGYAVGFSGVCTTLVLKKSWREAFFGLLECMWDKVYVYVYIKWTRLTKPSSPSS